MSSRRTVRVALVAALTTGLLGVAAPAFANIRDDGEEPGSGLPVLLTLLFYVVVPLALFALITALVLAPSMRRGPRYRPSLGWWAAPMWFGGPHGDPDAAVGAATRTADGGGASARW